MKSTSENPLAFFEFILDENQIKQEIDKKLINYDFRSYSIYLPDEIRYVEYSEDGDSVEGELPVSDVIIPLLRIEFEKSKKLLLDTFLQKSELYNKNFLLVQFNTIQSLVVNKFEFLNKYPYFLLPLRGIIKFLNDKLLHPEMQQFILNEEKVEFSPINENLLIEKSNDKIIEYTLSYMKGKNEKQESILNGEDYQLLLEYTTHLVAQEEIPSIKKKLAPKLSNDVLRFTFWVLHRELYTTKSIRPYFYDFIKEVFIKFKDNDISSIKGQFGTQARVARHKFLPEIITQHLK